MQAVKQWIKKNFGALVYRRQLSRLRKREMENWLKNLNSAKKLNAASYDIFTYHGEDGIILYLLHQLKEVPQLFIDIGSGDCIKSNCANLAVHFGWQGVFVDKNKRQLDVGRSFYKRSIQGGASLQFVEAEVTEENINSILSRVGVKEAIGLLSIDIDGNDYWIWNAIEAIRPSVVVIEAKVEFGELNIIVPPGPDNHHSVDKMYNGASVEALRLLGLKKGYKLAGANKQGYNLFFVQMDAPVPGVTTREILDDPEILSSFYPEEFFAAHKFEKG